MNFEKVLRDIRAYWLVILVTVFSLAFSFLALTMLSILVYAVHFSISAIVGTSTALLTIEGFLMGLSSLIENRRSRTYVLTVTLGLFSVMFALISIAVSQEVLALQILYPQQTFSSTSPVVLGLSPLIYFIISAILFIFMLELYWISVMPSRKKERDFLPPGPY
jgi:hypothetical protein